MEIRGDGVADPVTHHVDCAGTMTITLPATATPGTILGPVFYPAEEHRPTIAEYLERREIALYLLAYWRAGGAKWLDLRKPGQPLTAHALEEARYWDLSEMVEWSDGLPIEMRRDKTPLPLP